MRVVLASESESRKRALEILGLKYEVRPSAINEKAVRDLDPAVMTRKLAEAKAWAVVNAEAQRMQAAAAAGTSSSALGGGGAASPSVTSSDVNGSTGGAGEVGGGGALVEGPAVVVAGDAVVTKEGRIFEKPVNVTHALEFLHDLSGSAFKFVTSLVVIRTDNHKMLSTVEISTIRFRELVEREIRDYVMRYPVLQFAGAFEADGVARFAESVSGSYNFMTGIPVSRLAVFLRQMGVAV